MGQKSNILTLRHTKKNLSFLESNNESKKFLYGFKFLQFIQQLLSRKNILIVDKTMTFSNNQYSLFLKLFYKTAKLSSYKKKIRRSGVSTKKLNAGTAKLFLNHLSLLRTNLALLYFKNVNQDVNRSIIRFLYQRMNRFSGVLFSRRFNLFLDFIKIVALFSEGKVSAHVFLLSLGQIFKILPKRKHSRFFFFLRFLLETLVTNKQLKEVSTSILGVKITVNGKLQGKTRADSRCIQVGAVPIQSIDKNLDFSRLHVYTLYGAFGFKIWLHRKNYKIQ